MPELEVVQDTPAPIADLSIAQIRAELTGQSTAAAQKPAAAEEKPAAEPEKKAEPEAAPESEPEKKQEPERDEKGRFKKVEERIGELTKNWRTEQRKREELEARLAELSGSQPATKTAPAKADNKPVAPKLAEFDEYEKWEAAHAEYIDKLTDWKADQRDKARDAKAAEAKAAEEQQSKADAFTARMDAFGKDHPDLDEVINAAKMPKGDTGNAMLAAIVEHEHGPAIAYELAKHQDDIDRIGKLSPTAALIEIGKIAAKLSKAPEQKKTVTDAPKPPAQVSGGAAPKAFDFTASPYGREWKRQMQQALKGE